MLVEASVLGLVFVLLLVLLILLLLIVLELLLLLLKSVLFQLLMQEMGKDSIQHKHYLMFIQFLENLEDLAT